MLEVRGDDSESGERFRICKPSVSELVQVMGGLDVLCIDLYMIDELDTPRQEAQARQRRYTLFWSFLYTYRRLVLY